MNKAILIGRLTRNPETKMLESGTVISKFSLAVNRRFVKQGEERQADFINITAWGKTAEFVQKYFNKGLQVAIIGRIETRSWQDDQEITRYATDVVAEEVHFADSKRDDSNPRNDLEKFIENNSELGYQTSDLPF